MKAYKTMLRAIYLLVSQVYYDVWDACDDWYYLIILDYSKDNHECFWDQLTWKCPVPKYFYDWASLLD